MDCPTRYGGVDWATKGHAACIVDERGEAIERFEVEHTQTGLGTLGRRLTKAGVTRVAIERPDGPVIEVLFAAGLEVVVVASRHVKALRTRYGTAGNKDDRGDAYILADVLRTDGHRLRSLRPDQPATVTLRATVRARKDLVQTRTRLTQQLRAHLELVFPGAVGLFADLDSPIALRFLLRFPSAAKAAWLSPKRMAAWLHSEGYSGRTRPDVLHERLATAPIGLTGREAEARAAVTVAFVRALLAVREQVAELEARIREQLEVHPDGTIFRSLPRAGQVRAATLLAEIGDVRERFPTPESLACLAGAAPSTRQSGQHRVVTFRFACDKKLRDALLDFAEDSRFANPWAAAVYGRAIARKHTHPHAARVLARAWVYVLWRCWQDRIPYDPTRHRALNRLQLERAA
jgi:transposase